MDIKVYLENIKNKELEDIILNYKDYLKEQDLIKADRFKPVLNKKQSLISSILKNKYIKGNITYSEFGKPLSDSEYFNVSHSEDYIALAISQDIPIGIDIEYIKNNVNDDLVSYVCDSEEIEFVKENKSKNFYYLWTRKEAILKCIGSGLIKDLKSINCLNDFGEYRLYSYFIDEYVLTIAIKNNGIDYNIIINKNN